MRIRIVNLVDNSVFFLHPWQILGATVSVTPNNQRLWEMQVPFRITDMQIGVLTVKRDVDKQKLEEACLKLCSFIDYQAERAEEAGKWLDIDEIIVWEEQSPTDGVDVA